MLLQHRPQPMPALRSCLKHAGSLDFILDAVSADHDINAYINLLGASGDVALAAEYAFALNML